jgi:hypothetical protein
MAIDNGRGQISIREAKALRIKPASLGPVRAPQSVLRVPVAMQFS